MNQNNNAKISLPVSSAVYEAANSNFFQHLRQRGWSPIFNSWVDRTNEIVTFPLFVPYKLIGYQRYDWRAGKKRDNGPKGRYFTWISDPYKKCYAYGYDNLFGYGPLFVVEGIWDAIRVTTNWFDCLALLTATPTKQTKQWLRFIAGRRPIIAIADDDKKLGAGWADYQIVPTNFSDISDMPHKQAGEFLHEFAKEIRVIS